MRLLSVEETKRRFFMPRNKRFIPASDAALHIITRGNNRYYLFANDEDKAYYLNPVRAKIVSMPEEYHFSSYRYYACGRPDALITPSPAYLGLSTSEEKRRELYIAFVVDSSIINSRSLETQLFIGSSSFINKLEEY